MNLTGADLTYAELYDMGTLGTAILRDTDLRGTDLEGEPAGTLPHDYANRRQYATVLLAAYTRHGTFLGARWSEETRWPLTMADKMRDRSEQIEPGIWQIKRS